MFDPAQSAALHEPGLDGPIRANMAALSTPQRSALINLLCGPARRLPSRRGRWIITALGTTWAIEPKTIEALTRAGLVIIAGGGRAPFIPRAKLTPRGLWYARSAVQRAVGDTKRSQP